MLKRWNFLKTGFYERIKAVNCVLLQGYYRFMIAYSPRRMLGDNTGNPTYIFAKRRIAYWMAEGEGRGPQRNDEGPTNDSLVKTRFEEVPAL